MSLTRTVLMLDPRYLRAQQLRVTRQCLHDHMQVRLAYVSVVLNV
jgi:hypothetical protein